MATEDDENERGRNRPASEFGPPVGDFGPPVDDAGFGGPLAVPPPAPPGPLPEVGWRPAQPGSAPAPGPFGAPVGAPMPPAGPVPPAAPGPVPPAGNVPPNGPVPPRGSDPVVPPRRSAPTSVFGDAVSTPPPTSPPAPPRSSAPTSVFGGATPPPANPVAPPRPSPFGDAVATPPPVRPTPPADPTVRFGADASAAGSSVFGDSVPVTSGKEETEVIRRNSAPRQQRVTEPERTPEPPRAPAKDNDAEDRAWWNSPDDDGGVPKPPEPGLSWADDPIARRLAPKTPTAPVAEESEPDNRMRWIIGGVVAAVLLVVALVLTIGLVKRGGGEDPGPTAAPVTSAAGADCRTIADEGLTVGNGPGDTSSGARAILGFQYAFYVERSGARVREFVAPDAVTISPADVIQKAIDDQIPRGTTHCVKVRETGVGVYDVELREWHPDRTSVVYKQEIVTTLTDGKWQVKSITALP